MLLYFWFLLLVIYNMGRIHDKCGKKDKQLHTEEMMWLVDLVMNPFEMEQQLGLPIAWSVFEKMIYS